MAGGPRQFCATEVKEEEDLMKNGTCQDCHFLQSVIKRIKVEEKSMGFAHVSLSDVAGTELRFLMARVVG